MTRRTIVFIHSSDELYGADRVLLDLLDILPSDWHAEVLLPTDLPHGSRPLCRVIEDRGHRVQHVDLPVLRRAYRTPSALTRLAIRRARLTAVLRAQAPAVVYCTTSATFLAMGPARRSGAVRVLGHVQELWTRSDAMVLGRLAAGSDQLVAISDAVATALPARLRARTTTIVNATSDPGEVDSLAGRSGPLQYLIASRWNSWKGHRTLLSAWGRAGCPGRLIVLGAPPASGDSVDVPALVADLPDPNSVTIVGEVADPDAWLRAADVVLMPSDAPEPFGLVAIEAFARARPVIASAAGGLAGTVTDGVDGWTFPPADVERLSAVLAGLDREMVSAAGEAARDTYRARFTLERYAEQWCRLLTA